MWEIEVLYGLHAIRNHRVRMTVDPTAPRSGENVRLAQAPTNPKEFPTLAVPMAKIHRFHPATHSPPPRDDGHSNDPDPEPAAGAGVFVVPRAASTSGHPIG